MSEASLPRKHYPALDGVRGIAIALVVLFHNFGFIDYFFFGWLGVDLFFVLSGFLITDILVRSVGRPGYLKNFFIRRALRIFPLYYFLLFLFLVVFPAFSLFKKELHYFLENQVWLWTYLQNWLFATRDLGNSNVLFHLWSLAVEEQFYLVWPFIILLVRDTRWLLAICLSLLAVLFFTRLILWQQQIPGFNYFSLYTFTRMDGIFIGSALSLTRHLSATFITRHTAKIVLAAAAMNFLFYLVNSQKHFSIPYFPIIGYVTFVIVFAVLINEAASEERNWLTRLLGIAPLRFLGKISYGFYLIHWPLHRLAADPVNRLLLQGLPLDRQALLLLTASITTLTALLLSVLSYRYFESGFLRLKDKFAPS